MLTFDNVLKRRFLVSDLTKSLTVYNFEYTWAMTIFLFLKMSKLNVPSINWTKNYENIFEF